MTKLRERVQADGPKHILTLDGGGIRGIITLEILHKIEKLLQKKLNRKNDFVLADFFDFVAGTSTGAIIAACISMGMSVDKIKRFYMESGRTMFDKASLLRRYRYKYEDDNLAEMLRKVIHSEIGVAANEEVTLGSPYLRTLLMMVMRNSTTDSPWPVSNNPFAKYNQIDRDDCNLELPLWQLIRASTAAPVYFPPEVVRVGPEKEKEFIFVDGGITPYNNPSFQSFLMATVEPYKLEWQTGEDKMLLVSIGTGTSPDANADLNPSEMNLLYNASSLPSALMFASLNEQDLLCRVFGNCLAGDHLDNEIGDLISINGPVSPKLFTYLRYNAELTRTGLDLLDLPDVNPKDVQKLDSVENIADLQRVGRTVAKHKVKAYHFDRFA